MAIKPEVLLQKLAVSLLGTDGDPYVYYVHHIANIRLDPPYIRRVTPVGLISSEYTVKRVQFVEKNFPMFEESYEEVTRGNFFTKEDDPLLQQTYVKALTEYCNKKLTNILQRTEEYNKDKAAYDALLRKIEEVTKAAHDMGKEN